MQELCLQEVDLVSGAANISWDWGGCISGAMGGSIAGFYGGPEGALAGALGGCVAGGLTISFAQSHGTSGGHNHPFQP